MCMQLSSAASIQSDVLITSTTISSSVVSNDPITSVSIPSNTFTESTISGVSTSAITSDIASKPDISHMTHLEFERFLVSAIQSPPQEQAKLINMRDLRLLEKEALQGSKELLYRLGAIFYYGIGVTAHINDFRRTELSRNFLSQAAKRRVAEAQYLYACTFHDGKMQEKWLNRAAKKGYAPAYIKLAAMAEECRLEMQDFNQYYQWQHWAIKLLEKAYQLGNHQEAAQQIARIYINGLKNVHPVLDYSAAEQWIEPLTTQAKTAGEACYALGLMFLRGQDQNKDYSLAGYWFQRALQGGYTAAEFELGYMYEQGWGCPINLVITQQKYLCVFEVLIQELTTLKQQYIDESLCYGPQIRCTKSLTPVQQQIDWNYFKCRHILEFLASHQSKILQNGLINSQTELINMQHTLNKFRKDC